MYTAQGALSRICQKRKGASKKRKPCHKKNWQQRALRKGRAKTSQVSLQSPEVLSHSPLVLGRNHSLPSCFLGKVGYQGSCSTDLPRQLVVNRRKSIHIPLLYGVYCNRMVKCDLLIQRIQKGLGARNNDVRAKSFPLVRGTIFFYRHAHLPYRLGARADSCY